MSLSPPPRGSSPTRCSESILDYDRALLLDNSLHVIRLNRGVAHMMTGNYVAAERDLSAVAVSLPDNVDVFVARGTVWSLTFHALAPDDPGPFLPEEMLNPVSSQQPAAKVLLLSAGDSPPAPPPPSPSSSPNGAAPSAPTESQSPSSSSTTITPPPPPPPAGLAPDNDPFALPPPAQPSAAQPRRLRTRVLALLSDLEQALSFGAPAVGSSGATHVTAPPIQEPTPVELPEAAMTPSAVSASPTPAAAVVAEVAAEALTSTPQPATDSGSSTSSGSGGSSSPARPQPVYNRWISRRECLRRAVADFERAISLDPQRLEAYDRLAALWREAGIEKRANEVMERRARMVTQQAAAKQS